MNIRYLLLGTCLSFIPILSYAQCVETTNCETLGYTETTCNGGKVWQQVGVFGCE